MSFSPPRRAASQSIFCIGSCFAGIFPVFVPNLLYDFGITQACFKAVREFLLRKFTRKMCANCVQTKKHLRAK